MTQEEKQLLLKDLCARLPYGMKGEYQWKGNTPYNRELDGHLYNELSLSFNSTEDSSFMPYLRPMDSMTVEELIHYSKTREWKYVDDDHYECFDTLETFEWLNEHHFDYRGLIPMGLALEAPNDMYKTE